MSQALEYATVLWRHIWWLLLVPLLVAVVAYAGISALPKSYTSIATLILDDTAVLKANAYMRSGAVTEAVAQRHPGFTSGSARFRWVTTSGEPRRTASLFNFIVQDQTPERAQSVSATMLDIWLELTKPRPDYRERILQDLERNKAELKLAGDLIQQVQSEAPRQANHPMLDPASTLPALLTRRDTLVQNIAKGERELKGFGRDVVLTPPSLPTTADPSRALVFAAAAAGFVFLFVAAIVLLKHAIGRLSAA